MEKWIFISFGTRIFFRQKKYKLNTTRWKRNQSKVNSLNSFSPFPPSDFDIFCNLTPYSLVNIYRCNREGCRGINVLVFGRYFVRILVQISTWDLPLGVSPGIIPRLGHYRFLPDRFQFIIQFDTIKFSYWNHPRMTPKELTMFLKKVLLPSLDL